MIEHFGRDVDPPLWKSFWEYWTAFLISKGADLSPEQELAWQALGTRFNEEAQSYLAKVGRPHA
ncbi:unnamed protein product [Cylicocyclus nassatus]|uniref:Globin domain-containing protein n=1 Tax=Cylicocyclus nassatus TaxID=53992 RepID=A0AA36H8V0_CYLNA|nr:unnamed protein product [Cylicocyclus nassatus]